MMEQQYKEAVDNGEPMVASQNNLSETISHQTQQTDKGKDTLQSAESNTLEKGEVHGNSLDQANIETVDPSDISPEALGPFKELSAEQKSSRAQCDDKKVASSCSQLVVQESDQEELKSPVKEENISQRSRLSLSGRKKRKISVSDTDSAPACTSTPKAATELNREVGSPAKKTETLTSPLKNCTPIIKLNEEQGNIRILMCCIRFGQMRIIFVFWLLYCRRNM